MAANVMLICSQTICGYVLYFEFVIFKMSIRKRQSNIHEYSIIYKPLSVFKLTLISVKARIW